MSEKDHANRRFSISTVKLTGGTIAHTITFKPTNDEDVPENLDSAYYAGGVIEAGTGPLPEGYTGTMFMTLPEIRQSLENDITQGADNFPPNPSAVLGIILKRTGEIIKFDTPIAIPA